MMCPKCGKWELKPNFGNVLLLQAGATIICDNCGFEFKLKEAEP